MILLWILIKKIRKLKEYKYRIKKTQIPKFINIELKSDSESSDSDLEVESKSDAKLIAKLEKYGSDSELDIKS